MKQLLLLFFTIALIGRSQAQIDPELLRSAGQASDSLKLNMDAIYNRPFAQVGKLPVALGGYMEANYQYLGENGITEGHQFQMRRVSIFISSSIARRMKFLT